MPLILVPPCRKAKRGNVATPNFDGDTLKSPIFRSFIRHCRFARLKRKPRKLLALQARFTVDKKLDSRTLIESHFQRLLLLQSYPWGECPELNVITRLRCLAARCTWRRSQPRWAIDEFPRDLESFRKMRCERFHAKDFRRVMSTQ